MILPIRYEALKHLPTLRRDRADAFRALVFARGTLEVWRLEECRAHKAGVEYFLAGVRVVPTDAAFQAIADVDYDALKLALVTAIHGLGPGVTSAAEGYVRRVQPTVASV